MPVEIRELIIRTTITSGAKTIEGSSTGEESDSNEKQIIAECVDQVLKILERQKER